jgi:DNA repair exonuclease SbcCD ATPase subunit
MRIEVVQLENIRSHLKSTVPFTSGFNCLVGGLGCGKSSVLYSIDFALFGDPIGRSFEYLLREGIDSGKVTVQFTQNGKTYKLSRGLKRHAKGISQDIEELKFYENDALIASMKTDAINEQFKAITGLDKELYREIVWMRQEHLKELLDAAPRERQRRLDELFGLSDYEVAWSNIANYQREYEVEKRTYEKDPDVTGMEKLSGEYNRVTEEYTILEIELQDTTKKLAHAKKVLEDSEAKLHKLEEKKRAVEELRRKEAHLQANVANLEDACSSLSARIEGKGTIFENLKQRQNSIETQKEVCKSKLELAGVVANQPIKTLQSYVLGIDDKISSLKAEKEAATQNVQTDQKRTASLSLESRCPLCLQPLNDKYKDGLLQRIKEENATRQNAIEQLQSEIEEFQRTKALATEAISNLQTLMLKADDLKIRINEEEKNLSDLSNELAQKQSLEMDLCGQLENVRFEISRFEISDLEIAKTQKEQAVRQYYFVESDLRTK